MDFITGRANSITDYLITLHNGPWFHYDRKEELYENLIVKDGYDKPTENECLTALTEMQAEYDALAYSRSRKEEYDKLNQFELISDDSINGTTTHKDAILAIKDKYPKE